MQVLGIETSCDETGVAIYHKNLGLLSNQLHSQSYLHDNYGGIVPELAARNHVIKIIPLIKQSLKESKIKLSELNGIAYTAGPGLSSSLLVGAGIGSALSFALNIPNILVHHMEAHLLSFAINTKKNISHFFPFLALLVSGGHTQLIYAKNLGEYTILGETVDDAAGEVIDKIAKLLKTNIPGGLGLYKLAQTGNPNKFNFPRPMTKTTGLNFSFSGLKTAVKNTIKKMNNKTDAKNIAASFQEAIIDTLIIKCIRAIKITNLKKIIISGGVSSNILLRNKINKVMKNIGVKSYFTDINFCTDNAAMIAYTGLLRLKGGFFSSAKTKILPKWKISDLKKIKI
ncbi:tRNA (adenosine(37)-N6)-threonylcarbamoyltransferase complex transferase subunit TsaD [Buchnera aphidicola (Kurisakia onigurumii)]|uniref:tRNA (adenosine(37)-N6)-threonylcarbamoyltransferase complex transferase subunit TsaD n=1 Tax=Buchnera aphidicola TaxID=9 RepID=UPI0031B7027F